MFGIVLLVAIWAVATERTMTNKGWKSLHALDQSALTWISDRPHAHGVNESMPMDESESMIWGIGQVSKCHQNIELLKC